MLFCIMAFHAIGLQKSGFVFLAETATPVEEAKWTTRSNMKWKLKKQFMLPDGISTFITEKSYTITLIQGSSEDVIERNRLKR